MLFRSRMIGDPVRRFREDPVRIIRAIRFAAKLNFTIESETEKAILQVANDLKLVSSSRLFEEIVKLFHSGNGVKSYHLLKKYQLMPSLFDQTAAIMNDETEQFIIKALENTDARIHQDKPITPAFLFAVFLWFPLLKKINVLEQEGMSQYHALEHAMSEVIHQQRQRTALSKRLAQVIKEIWLLQYRLTRRYGKRPFILFRHPRFRAAYDFLLLRACVNDADPELATWWTRFQEETEDDQLLMIQQIQRQQQRPKSKKND